MSKFKKPLEELAKFDRQELSLWAKCPDDWVVALCDDDDDVTTRLGTKIGELTYRNVFGHSVTFRFIGTNGAEYYGKGGGYSKLFRVHRYARDKTHNPELFEHERTQLGLW
jgi:hypothetical protein